MIGKRVGMLTAESVLPGSKVVCMCDCGQKRTLSVGHFNANYYKSCGCHVIRHGHATNKTKSREYTSYHNMKARCLNKANKRYKDYGGAGITICNEWIESFERFLEDMGDCPEGYTIDRIDNTKGYFKENCRWATRSRNQRNRKVSGFWVVHGVKYETMQDAGNALGVSPATIGQWCKGRKAGGKFYPAKEGCHFEPIYLGEKQ